jgi:hypothetical protein
MTTKSLAGMTISQASAQARRFQHRRLSIQFP